MRRLLSRFHGEEGFTIIEVLAAAIVLVIGIGAMLTVFSASGKLTLAAERSTSEAHRASLELERLKSLPWGQIALTGTSSQWSTTSTDYTYVGGLSGSCPAAPSGAAPQYQPDHKPGGSTATEPLVINGCSYTLNGSSTQIAGGTVAPVTSWSDGHFTGNMFDFITWVNDPTCSQTQTAGSNCPTTNDYKRITIVVTINGATEPANPAIVSELLPNPNQYSSSNPDNATTNCTNSSGQTVPCDTVSGSPTPFPLCDESYSSSCGGGGGTPSCSGNTDHQTVFNWLNGLTNTAPTPDLLGTTLPTGLCQTNGVPTPPCYGTDVLGSGCQGLPFVPSAPCNGSGCSTGTGGNGQGGCTANCGSNLPGGDNLGGCSGGTGCGPGGVNNAICGTAPPSSNTKAHSWVTAPIGLGSSVNLTGAGSLTAYLESGSGVAVNATVCLGVYVVPGGVIGALSGNLLASRIGVVAAANVVAQAGFPTPVSFSFNLGTADTVTGSLLGTRIEVVLWVAASASTDVQLAYDQAEVASEVTLVEQ